MVNWGIIGCGGIARRRVVPALGECRNTRIVAVTDLNKSATDEVAAQIGARPYRSEGDLLADQSVQAVYIATPAFLHHDQTIRAAQAGKHILVEKPFGLTVSEAEEMIAVCKRAGVYLTVGHMMRYNALNVKAREMVRNGDMGDIVFARAQLSCWYPDIAGAWRQDPNLGGGGALIDMATHCYDLLQDIIGSLIVEVFAFTDTLTFKYRVEDSSTTLLRFANGAHGVVDAFFNVPDNVSPGRLEVYGNKGSIQAEGTIGQMPGGRMIAYLCEAVQDYDPQQSRTGGDVTIREVTCTPVNMYAAELDYLSRCIEEATPPTVNTGEDGLGVLRVARAAYESSATGRSVRLPNS